MNNEEQKLIFNKIINNKILEECFYQYRYKVTNEFIFNIPQEQVKEIIINQISQAFSKFIINHQKETFIPLDISNTTEIKLEVFVCSPKQLKHLVESMIQNLSMEQIQKIKNQNNATEFK